MSLSRNVSQRDRRNISKFGIISVQRGSALVLVRGVFQYKDVLIGLTSTTNFYCKNGTTGNLHVNIAQESTLQWIYDMTGENFEKPMTVPSKATTGFINFKE